MELCGRQMYGGLGIYAMEVYGGGLETICVRQQKERKLERKRGGGGNMGTRDTGELSLTQHAE